MIFNLQGLLDKIKDVMENEFQPSGYYYVDKLVRNGMTSVVIHVLFDNEEERFRENFYPKVKGDSSPSATSKE